MWRAVICVLRFLIDNEEEVNPYGVVPSQMVGVLICVNLPLHHKVQNFSSGTGTHR